MSRSAVETTQVSTNGVSASATSTGASMSFEDLSDIVRLVQASDIVEFELKSKKFHLSVRKREALAAELAAAQAANAPQYAPAQYAMPMQQMAAAPAGPAPAAVPAPPAVAAPKPAAAPVKLAGVEMASPMSGTMYRAAAPGEPPLVNVGDIVKQGQTICIIEAMKLMNEIEAEVSGEVIKWLVDSGSPVSPGQAIMLIKP